MWEKSTLTAFSYIEVILLVLLDILYVYFWIKKIIRDILILRLSVSLPENQNSQGIRKEIQL